MEKLRRIFPVLFVLVLLLFIPAAQAETTTISYFESLSWEITYESTTAKMISLAAKNNDTGETFSGSQISFIQRDCTPATCLDDGCISFNATVQGVTYYNISVSLDSLYHIWSDWIIDRYGSKVITYGGKDGWLMIDYGNATGYIMAKYLVKEKPAPYDGSSSGSSGAKKAGSFNVKEATNVAQLNSLAASAKFVTPYTVTVHPTTAKGSVYVRWFPTKNAETLLTLADGYELTVISELTDWYQVSDPETGKVGFVYYTYVK